MNEEKKASCAVAFMIASLLVSIMAISSACGWYRASVQADVWRREGIEMSTWEVYWGARPAERSITIHEGGKK